MTQIKSSIQQSNYSIEMKDFLNLFLAYEVVYLWNQWKSDLETREKEEAHLKRYQLLDSNARTVAKSFVVKYPDSEFNPFINEFILYEDKLKK